MRKFLLNGALISAVFSVIGVARQTAVEPRKWRAVLLWASWGLSVALAVGAVLDARDDARELDA